MRTASHASRMRRFGAVLALSIVWTAPLAEAGTTGARVTKVIDGDTFDVDLNGDGAADERVRLIGIDTPEKGDCGYWGARKALTSLVGGKRVTLYTDGRGSTGRRGRILRGATVRWDGRTVDVSQWMLRRGWGPWRPYPNETSRNLVHHVAEEQAASEGLRYFDRNRCANGPGPAAALEMRVQWHADSADGIDPLNQEFIRITNTGSTSIDLDGWPLRTGNVRGLRVPPGAPLPADRTLTIHVGSGTDGRYHRYLDRTGFFFPDIDIDDDGVPHHGEGVYLLDRHGDLRAHQTWPCALGCADPTGGDLRLTVVEYDPDGVDDEHVNEERVRIANDGSSPIELGDLVLEIRPYIYEFPPALILPGGASLVVHMGKGTDSAADRYIGSSKAVLRNAGDRVLIRTYDAIVVACEVWGDHACPPAG